jgi:uncharacterized membrane protein
MRRGEAFTRVNDPTELPMTPSSNASNPDRAFFASMAALALALVVVGFAPTFFLKDAFDAPDLSPLVHVHGVLFTAWPALLLAQALLIRNGKYALHRTLGAAGAALAIAMVITGFMVVLGKPRFNIASRAFIFTPLLGLILFPLFVAAAIRLRRDAQAHKRLMLLATILLITAGTRRVLHLLGFEPGPYVAELVTYALLLLPLAIYDLTRLHRLHPVTAWGGAILLLRHALHAAVAYTDGWQHFAARVTAH